MPAFEDRLPAEDRWAVALYAIVLRLPHPGGRGRLRRSARSPVTGRMSDTEVLTALGTGDRPRPRRRSLRGGAQRGRESDLATAQVFDTGPRAGRLRVRARALGRPVRDRPARSTPT